MLAGTDALLDRRKQTKHELTLSFVKSEIHPLLWKPECFGLTHHLCRSNRADVAQRRGARKQRTYQSGITEEDVCRLRDKRAHVVRRDRDERTGVLIILERYINTRTGTDGIRTRDLLRDRQAC